MKTFFTLMLVAASLLLLTSFGGDGNTDYPGGSPGGYTGSPGDGKTCKQCHGGTVANVTGWITSNIPTQGYTAGTSYTITVTVTGTGSKGFEVSPQNASGGLLGTLSPGSGTKLCNGNKAVTQNSSSTSNPKIWTFTWTAPAAGTGDVTFYGAFTVSKPNTKLCTMTVSEYNAAPLSVTATATPSAICYGSNSQLNATPTGGSGTYTYSWTSNPAGYTSTSQNPVVEPTVTTEYTVVVNDGTNNASASVTVTVTPPPTANAGNNSTCNPLATQIQLNGTASNYASLTWSTSGDGTFSSTSILNPLYYPGNNDKNTGSVHLTLTATPLTPCSANATSTVTIEFVALSVLASANPGHICEGATAQLNANPAGGNGTYTYSWTSVPAGYGSTAQSPVVQPVVNTLYIVVVNDGTSSASDTTAVDVTEPPAVNAGNDTTCFQNITEIQLNGVAVNYTSLLWTTSGDGTFSNTGILNPLYYPGTNDRTSGSVHLTLSANPVSPCASSSSDMLTIEFLPVGLKNPADNSVSISPNPTTGLLYITFKDSPSGKVMLTVYDIYGRAVLNSTVSITGNVVKTLDLTGSPRGTYFIKAEADSQTSLFKVILY